MRKLLLAAFAALFAFPAVAADLPVKAAPVPPAYMSDYFSGLYIGAHGGYGFDRGDGTGTATTAIGTGATSFATAPQGFIGGLHIGWGTRVGNGFYFGVEGDGDIATLDGTANNPGFIGNINSKNRWLASLRGRFGFIVVPNLLAYATGGWGWGGSSFTVTGTDGTQFSTSPTLNGAVLGGGIEIALNPNWGLRAEYLHYFLNDLNAATTGVMSNGVVALPANIFANVKDNVDVARVGLSYRF